MSADERRVFMLSADQWDAFVALLDAPESNMPRLTALLTEPTTLDVECMGILHRADCDLSMGVRYSEVECEVCGGLPIYAFPEDLEGFE